MSFLRRFKAPFLFHRSSQGSSDTIDSQPWVYAVGFFIVISTPTISKVELNSDDNKVTITGEGFIQAPPPSRLPPTAARLIQQVQTMSKNFEIPLHLYQALEEEYISMHGPLRDEDIVELPFSKGGEKIYRRVEARRDWLFHRGHLKNPLSLALKLLPQELWPSSAKASSMAAQQNVPPPQAAAKTPASETTNQTLNEYLRQEITDAVLLGITEHISPDDDLNELFAAATTEATGESVPSPGEAAGSQAEGATTGQQPRPETAQETIAPQHSEARDLYEKKRLRADALKALEEKLDKILENEEDPLYTSVRFRYVTPGDVGGALIRMGVKRFPKERVVFRGEDLIQFKRILLEEAFPDEIEKISNIRLASITQYLHSAGHAALSLSGGGIRSGTFALGIIQVLSRRKMLGQLHYLSTVSGGGYIGSWLTAWIHRHRDGLPGVENDLRNIPPDSEIDPDPEPIRYLRRYSNFITPKVGLLSADTWTFAAIYVRNLVLNWLVLIPLLLGWLMMPRVYNSLLLTHLSPAQPSPCSETRATVGWLASLLSSQWGGTGYVLLPGFVLMVCAIAYIIFNRPYVLPQFKSRRPLLSKLTDQKSFLTCCLLPLTVAAGCLTIYWARSLDSRCGQQSKEVVPYLLFGVLVTVSGWLVAMIVLRRYRPAHWHEISLLELIALTGAGVGGGALFWLTEKIVANPVRHVITDDWHDLMTELYTCLGVPVFFVVVLLAMTLFVGLTSHSKKFTDEDREWWARAGAWILIVVIAWVVFGSLVIFGPLVLLRLPTLFASVGGVSGLLALLAGRSSKTMGNDQAKSEPSLFDSISGFLLPFMAALFIAVFISLLSLLTNLIIVGLGATPLGHFSTLLSGRWQVTLFTGDAWYYTGCATFVSRTGQAMIIRNNTPEVCGSFSSFMQVWAVHYPTFWLVFSLMLVLLGVGFFMARCINLNRFSLHAGYRDRLIRGFLGASRGDTRKPNPFTGFDPLDNMSMHELRPLLFAEGDFASIGRLTKKLEAHDDVVSKHLWEKAISQKTKDEITAYSPDALPPQSLKAALIEDLNRALEDSAKPLYRESVFDALKTSGPASQFVEWAKAEIKRRERTSGQIEQYRFSTYAILFNRILLQSAYPDEIRKKYPPPHHLFHVVNTTLNLVRGDNLAWQQRKAEPFSFTPLHSGCFRLGYRSSRDYGGADGVTLGTAMATSGAAASSNMGYYTTSPVLSMVMTLFNVRLGWWLGNPGPAGNDTYKRQSPKLSVAPVVYEAFGLTDDKNPYVYLTDGGHFENLGLYEMVLRRCRLVILSDAAADQKYQFNDLGNAVRKIRIDLGVPVDFEEMPIFCGSFDSCEAKREDEDGDGTARGYWAVGRIRYSNVDKVWDEVAKKFVPAPDGLLIYVKPAVYGQEPQDVLNYKRSHNSFPHETTADQFFDEPQFESYRALGYYIMNRMCGGDLAALDDLYELAGRVYWQEGSQKKWIWPATDADDEAWRWLRDLEPKHPASP
jgi:hypothetical protein